MPTINRASGLQINLPDDYQLSEAAPAPATRARRTAVRGVATASPLPVAPDAASDLLLAALVQQDLQLFDHFALTPSATTAKRAARSSGPVELAVPLAANEDAVLLLEQDGMYVWRLPDAPPAARARTATRGATSRPATARQATFRLDLSGDIAPATATRGAAPRRNIVTDFVRDKIKGYVLKFTAPLIVDGVISFLERNARTGIVVLTGDDPSQWAFSDALPQLALPTNRPARILLFIHGTFSSTIGGFGALGATPWGQKFLAGARANYDAVLGFDHPTLSVDPLANATELLNRLQSQSWPLSPQIDIITHSPRRPRDAQLDRTPAAGVWMETADRARCFCRCHQRRHATGLAGELADAR